ncbi:hypothetical protein ACJA88_003510 [Fusarium oxysporum]
MPGAEAALLGVGILCNAMQILTFAKDSIHVYRNIRDGRAPDPELDSYLRNAKASFDEMNQAAAQMRPLSQAQQQIVDVGKMVHDCVDELQQQFIKLHVDEASKGGLRGKITASKKSVVALWRGKELQDAEKNLQRHEQLLHSLLLDRVCTQSQAAEISSLQSFGHLQGAVQSIISQLVGGSTKVSDLFTDFSSNVTDRLSEEHVTTRTVIEEHFNLAENTIHRSIAESVDKLRQELLEREQDKAFEKQHERLLSSLWFSEMNSRKNKISNNYPGTFGWVFELHRSLRTDHDSSPGFDQSSIDSQVPEDTQVNDITICRCFNSAESTEKPGFDCFPCWLESDSNLFWISGKPASGKSSLMKFLAFNNSTVNHLNSWHSDVQILTHFFWKPGQLLQQNVEGMVLSLLYQALDGKPGVCRRLCAAQPSVRHKRSYSDWSLEELTKSLLWALEASPEAFCILLDGLDETTELEHLPWPDFTNAEVIHQLLKVNDVKLCASSREEHAFCSFFEGASRLRMHQLNQRDITLFVRERLDIYGLECHDRDALVHETVRKAKGVFLWVALVVDRLNRAIRQGYATIEILEERLKQTPSDLTTLYTDMWGRIGDDAGLRSIRVTASLYFYLVIVARRVHHFLSSSSYFWKPKICGMSSLLIMATAAQDTSMETILSTGRLMTVEDLLTRCSKVEHDLKLACRGLLEVTRRKQESPSLWVGDERLREYNMTKVDFIHRSAFDFFLDTELGREFLHSYGSSISEQASRLLAAHLIRARFIYLKHDLDSMPMRIHRAGSNQTIFCDTYLMMAIALSSETLLFTEESFRDGLLDAVKEWQSSGLFSGHKYWIMPPCSQPSSNYLDLEFIEASISVASFNQEIWGHIVDVKSLLDRYPPSLFIDAVPIVFRALSLLHWNGRISSYLLDLLKYTFGRLQCIAAEEPYHRIAVKTSLRVFHCWYLCYCLGSFNLYNMIDRDARDERLDEPLTTEVLIQPSKTFLLEEDWQHPFLLVFEAGKQYGDQFKLFRIQQCFEGNCQYALVAVNFATAYRILGDVLDIHSWGSLNVQIPQGVDSHFDVILVADTFALSTDSDISGIRSDLRSMYEGHPSVDFYAPGKRFHDQIEHLLCMKVPKPRGLGGERSWPEVLKCSGAELSPIDASQAFSYVMDALKERGVELLLPDSLMWLRNALTE